MRLCEVEEEYFWTLQRYKEGITYDELVELIYKVWQDGKNYGEIEKGFFDD